jgi:hypothetical protein
MELLPMDFKFPKGISLVFVARKRRQIGLIVAAFLVCIFPSNIAQYIIIEAPLVSIQITPGL